MNLQEINRELELASKAHQAYLDKDKNQAIAERLDIEIMRYELGLKLKRKQKASEQEIRRCIDTLSLLDIIRGKTDDNVEKT